MIFMVLIFLLGIVLTVTSGKILKKIKKNCESEDLRNANRGILVIGVVAIVSSLSYMACHAKCACKDVGAFSTVGYMGFTFLLSIVLIALGSVVDKQTKNTGCEDAKGTSGLVIGIGVIMLLMSGGWGGYKGYEMYGHMIPTGGVKSMKFGDYSMEESSF